MQEHKPLYLYSREEALRHGERDQWRDSYRENCDCARAIERAIAENYRDNCLGNCAGSILDRYGFTRVNWVLANTMQQKSYDGRFSEGNKRWAKQFYIPNDDIRWHFTVESHPGLTNLFVEQVRDAWQSLGLFDASHCLPDDSDQDYTGKVVVIDPNILKDKYKTLEDQLFLAEGGFGASPNSRGRKVYGTLPKIESAEMMFSASRSRRLQIVPIIQSFSQLDKNYGKEGSEIIVDNTQVTLFGGFAPNSSSAEILSKALGSRTVMSGSVSRSKNDPSQSLQMMERPLLTSDELHSDRRVSRSRLCGFLRLIVTATGQCNGSRRANGNAREKLLHWSILPSVQTKTPQSRQALRLVNDSSIVHGRLALHGKASV